MSVHILYDPEEEAAALFCSTTDWAFGPLIRPCFFDTKTSKCHDSPVDIAKAFLRWLPKDVRELSDLEMEYAWTDFIGVGIKGCDYCGGAVAKGTRFCSRKCEDEFNEDELIRVEEAAGFADVEVAK